MWALSRLGVLVRALILLLVVKRMVECIAPGTGTAAALSLGAGTMILPFSTLYFSHVLSALLAFGAFALLWRERESSPRPILGVYASRAAAQACCAAQARTAPVSRRASRHC